MGGGIKLCAGIPTAVQDLLRQPRNKDYMGPYRIAGVHEITLPHVAAPKVRQRDQAAGQNS